METRIRPVVWALVAAVSSAVPQDSAGEAKGPAIRSQSAIVRTALFEGCRRSSTFRDQGRRVASADGIVLVEPGSCGGPRGCLLHWMATAGLQRMLRIAVDARGPIDELVAIIGHELQHAREVLDVASIRSGVDIYWHFRRPLASSARHFETAAAVMTAEQVRVELKRASSTTDHEAAACAHLFSIGGP